MASVKYYEKCQFNLGRRFRLAVDSAIEKIAEKPFCYRVLYAPFRRYLLQKFPFSIIYSIEPDHIRILAVAHTKRKPGFWLERGEDKPENLLE